VASRTSLDNLDGEYVLATQHSPHIRLLLTTLIWNVEKTELIDSYYGYILTLKTNKEINSIEDLKGKPFGFVNLDSTSGYVYPNALLREKGINPKTFFSKLYFLGSYPNVTDGIVAQSITAGATWQPNLINAIKKHGDVFKVVLQTPPIPNMCLATHPSLPETIRAKIEQFFQQESENERELHQLKFYNGFRELTTKLEELGHFLEKDWRVIDSLACSSWPEGQLPTIQTILIESSVN
jgi:ABC-type phosphate/phosphonate transport system substrate-binding protein